MTPLPAAPPAGPGAGAVRRSGSRLLVAAPPQMPPAAWLVLANELVAFAGARPAGEREYDVPADNAAELRRVLTQPWPAGRWPWEWTAAAQRAADGASRIAAAVRDACSRPLPPIDQALAEVAALVDCGFTRTLLPAQAVAVAALARAGSGGNFSVPGSGKTTMTYAVWALLRRRGLVDRMLVVAPLSAHEAWSEEAGDCFEDARRPWVELAPASPRRSADVVVVNYERAADGAVRAALDGWASGRRLLVVFDEAHRAKKGAAGSHGRGARDLASLADARLVLTGTPMPNGPDDLAEILDLAWPGHGARLADPRRPEGARTWVRVAKAQLGLPPATLRTPALALDDAHARLYRAVASGLACDAEALRRRPDLARRALMRLLACASNPALLAPGGSEGAALSWPPHVDPHGETVAALLDRVGARVRPAKLLAAARIASEHASEGRKLLVWTNFVGTARELARLLAPHAPAVVTGVLPVDDRSALTDRRREIARFRLDPDCGVLIATPQTLGEGISLHRACQSQVHVDRTFNAGLFLQALDRTHRVGMPHGSRGTAVALIAAGTIDEAVDAALRRKLAAMDAVLDDEALRRLAVPSDDDEAPPMPDGPDIEGLLAHLRRNPGA